ncbi:MAG: hypothetical protein JNN08_03560 [Bryobacterales bacterium]|nr:hypothetical protein [Bryobacterales bacterium]
MTYPSSQVPAGVVYNPVAGVQAVYSRNALSQMNPLTVGGQSVVTSACYNIAGQMWKQQIKAGSTAIGGWEYYFPASGNNGRITGTKDLQSLEAHRAARQAPLCAFDSIVFTYQYDSLNRLVSATKTGGGWSETYVYDGFGNLTTKGASTWLVDTATNRLHSSTGATYDNNGNLTALSGGVSFNYDTANRVTTANPTGEKYGYTTDNRRVYKYRPGWGEEITFWGPTGRLATYRIDTISNGTMYFVEQTRNVWFGSRLLRTGPAATPTKLATDRLGS